MKNIYVLWATIRPTMFVDTYNHWVDKSSKINSINYRIAVNTEDQKKAILEIIPDLYVRVLGDHIKGFLVLPMGLLRTLKQSMMMILSFG